MLMMVAGNWDEGQGILQSMTGQLNDYPEFFRYPLALNAIRKDRFDAVIKILGDKPTNCSIWYWLLLFANLLPGSSQNALPNPAISSLDKQAVHLLLSVSAFAINLGVVWSYAERLGARAGLSLDEIAAYLSYSIPLQAVGALLAAVLGGRFGGAGPMAPVVILQLIAAGMLLAALPGNDWLFFAGISAWGFSWNLGIAYLLGQAAVMRSGRRILTLVPCAEAIGVSAGPAIAAALVSGSDYLLVHVTAVVAVIISAGFYFRVNRKRIDTA